MIPSCISWCKYAKECIGEEKWEKIKFYIEDKQQKLDIKEKLIGKMREYYGSNIKKIIHTEKVLFYAEKILKTQSADRNIVVASAILHDINLEDVKKILSEVGIKKETAETILKSGKSSQ